MTNAHRFPQWNNNDVNGSLDRLREYVESVYDVFIGWYKKRSKGEKFFSLVLRAVSTILAVLGGVCPPIPPLDDELKFFNSLGYVLIATAGGLFLYNRSFGHSSSWVRFTRAQTDLEYQKRRFLLRWAEVVANKTANAPDPPTPGIELQAIAVVRDYIDEAHGIVKKETETWVSEFNSSLNTLDGYINRKGKQEHK